MPHKPRTKSNELIILELLNKRKTLTNKEKQHLFNLKKGYDGELIFDTLTEKLQCECLILNDLLLKVNNTTFQIDSLLIAPVKIYFYEVKNYEGDYIYESDKLFKKPRIEVINPLHQLSRSESLLRQLLLSLGFNPPIDASVVFINPTFTLYQAPLDKPFIFPTQINQHMEDLNVTPSKLNDNHKKLAEKLLSLNLDDSPFSQITAYQYDELRKGITCLSCNSFSVTVANSKCVCLECGNVELVTNAVLRAIKEFKILFPDKKITTTVIYDWCRVVGSKKTLRRILVNNFKVVGAKQWTYYE
ncbi:NERD domain-containing protein [Ornithinibacillus sp. L9]|uniref:NERD domain-containing protein n=1 Tax=Ornithinibacillus caprae TaxID=2678566 RepID=A0A6N8FN04_9BACI|nr:nuclease-related domain-containing protein [Ornithinibacillus caprae]MUK90581.1 NERD domain-containing protein [Ornithinibacillus caprae]